MNINADEFLKASALHLLIRIRDFLNSHPEILGETCKECDSDRTCAAGVHMSAEQFAKALDLKYIEGCSTVLGGEVIYNGNTK